MFFYEENEPEKTFEQLLEGSIKELRSGSTAVGTIIGFNENEVFVNLGYKYDGTVPMSEFTSMPEYDPENDLQIGNQILVLIVRIDDKEGKIHLSKRKVDFMKDFKRIEQAYTDREPVETIVTREVKGGVIARSGSFDIFVPASQISDRYTQEFSQYIGKPLLIKLIEYNEEKRRFVGSAKALILETRKTAEEQIFAGIQKGMEFRGVVRGITDFGVFVDIGGGVEGLVHISELSWSKIKHPSQIVHQGEEIDVYVISFDPEKKKISLGCRKEGNDPWTDVETKYPTGSIVHGRVARIVPFGAFVELERGVDGLVHISCVSNHRINRVEEVLHVGEEIDAKVVECNPVDRRISLSIKALLPDEPYDAATSEEAAPEEHAAEATAAVEVPPAAETESASTAMAAAMQSAAEAAPAEKAKAEPKPKKEKITAPETADAETAEEKPAKKPRAKKEAKPEEE